MKPIEILKKQHEAILAVTRQINAEASDASDECVARAVIDRINRLAEMLEEHLYIEDDFLYPALQKRTDQEVRDTARQFAVECGGIREAFEKYKVKWNSPGELRQSPEVFLSETQALARALETRVGKEDAELFPLLEC